MIVVDASVAAKWFLPEPDSEAAGQLLTGRRKLLAPDLIRVEVGAAITRRVRVGEITDEQARRLIASWTRALARGAVTLLPAQEDFDSAVELALRIRHPLQDCFYLAAATRFGVPLVTADRAFATRAGTVHPLVQGLGLATDG